MGSETASKSPTKIMIITTERHDFTGGDRQMYSEQQTENSFYHQPDSFPYCVFLVAIKLSCLYRGECPGIKDWLGKVGKHWWISHKYHTILIFPHLRFKTNRAVHYTARRQSWEVLPGSASTGLAALYFSPQHNASSKPAPDFWWLLHEKALRRLCWSLVCQ